MLSLDRIGAKLKLRFNNPALLEKALTHRSASGDNNERLEFLGDAVLSFIISECLYRKFTQADEGVLTRMRASLVNQQSLAEIARGLEIGSYLILGTGEIKSKGYDRDSILSDALEAIIGALACDQGIDVCREWIAQLFAEHIAKLSLHTWQKDPKTRLQELMQAQGLELPNYTLLEQTGQPHEQSFVVACRVALLDDEEIGVGTSRKKAEQQAAESILARLAECAS